jgi:stage II sporulation protein D
MSKIHFIGGRGFGHGVGMCQWCAKGMAESGMDWHTMITTFYPGIEIQKAY